MKRNTLAASLAMISILLTSCFDADIEQDLSYEDSVSLSETETTGSVSSTQPTFTTDSYTEEKESCTATVLYPILGELPNADAVNEAIYNAVVDFVQNDLIYSFCQDGFGTYEITSVGAPYLDNSFASFTFNGKYSADTLSHPETFIHTLNLDLASAKIIDTAEIIVDFERFTQHFESDVFTPTSNKNEALDKEIATLNKADLIGQYSAEHDIFPSIYFINGGTRGGPRIVVSVETVYTLGDNIAYIADIGAVSDCLSDEIIQLTKGIR